MTILDEYGRAVGRLDFYWDDEGVGGEADGRSKYRGPDGSDVLDREKDRHEEIEDLRVELARWRWWHVEHPSALRRKIDNALVRGRAREVTGVDRLWVAQPSPLAK